MGFLSGRKAKNSRFGYDPRFYDPKKEERLKQRMRIKSKTKARNKNQSLLTVGILFVLVLLIYLNV